MNGPPALTCRDETRRQDIRASKNWNGLDYVEVDPKDQKTLRIFFLKKAPQPPDEIRPANVVIAGCDPGARPVKVTGVRACHLKADDRDDCLHVSLDRPGDFSRYSLCLRELDEQGRPTDEPLHGFDPRYACLPLDFKVGCPSDLDCKTEPVCPQETIAAPEINYLAKDYEGFRQLLLDRLALTLPDWQERHVPDVGIALVEVLAYTADHLSYYQDAVATEAYLETARRRISVRRHVRLVDYPMHEGVNARAWVSVATDAVRQELPADGLACITGFAPPTPPPPLGKPLTADDLRNVPLDAYTTFLPVVAQPGTSLVFYQAHNEIPLYTWGDRECCLPRGATRATLVDAWAPSQTPGQAPGRKLALAPGDLLLFEEVLGPKTGNAADADPRHRHVVRLTRVTPGVDALYDPDKEPKGRPIVEIEWALPDALPFPLCLSAIGRPPECVLLSGISVARGNLFLADYGRKVTGEALGKVSAAPTPPGVPRCVGEGEAAEVTDAPGPFRPRLALGPLTFAQPLPAHARQRPAAGLLDQDPRQALPAVTLASDPAPLDGAWTARRDLLESGPDDPAFVVEVDDDGRGHLRFGDGELGAALLPDTTFTATYRVGNGPAGNLGAGALRYIVLADKLSGVSLKPRNPLPARGGTPPEPLSDVRLLAPHVFRRRLERAITADDYAALVERDFGGPAGRVERAAATLGWTGSWTEVVVAVDPFAAVADVDGLLAEIRRALQRYRRIGHDVVVARAVSVPLAIELEVCVLPHYLRGHVEADLSAVLGTGTLPSGKRGFFHPDNLTFGQGIALSRLVAAAQSVTGVKSVSVVTFKRLGHAPNGEIENGFLPLGPTEIARLDNDRRFPGNGTLKLDLRGGR